MTNSRWNVQLSADDWELVRHARLEALADSPEAFHANREHEKAWGEGDWRRTFCGARWVAAIKGEVIGLLRPARDRQKPCPAILSPSGSIPSFRKRGDLRSMLADVAEHEGVRGAHLLRLWVLERSPEDQQVYNQLGFAPLGAPEPLPGTIDRERRMSRSLTS
jgi:GNAT superfamily N-acetyltransferase